jgi:hypothetical protein
MPLENAETTCGCQITDLDFSSHRNQRCPTIVSQGHGPNLVLEIQDLFRLIAFFGLRWVQTAQPPPFRTHPRFLLLHNLRPYQGIQRLVVCLRQQARRITPQMVTVPPDELLKRPQQLHLLSGQVLNVRQGPFVIFQQVRY